MRGGPTRLCFASNPGQQAFAPNGATTRSRHATKTLIQVPRAASHADHEPTGSYDDRRCSSGLMSSRQAHAVATSPCSDSDAPTIEPGGARG